MKLKEAQAQEAFKQRHLKALRKKHNLKEASECELFLGALHRIRIDEGIALMRVGCDIKEKKEDLFFKHASFFWSYAFAFIAKEKDFPTFRKALTEHPQWNPEDSIEFFKQCCLHGDIDSVKFWIQKGFDVTAFEEGVSLISLCPFPSPSFDHLLEGATPQQKAAVANLLLQSFSTGKRPEKNKPQAIVLLESALVEIELERAKAHVKPSLGGRAL